MKNKKIYFDLHTHTVASGHGSTDTISDLAKAAFENGLSFLGISDHAPATPGSATESYFRGLSGSPRERNGVRLFYGVELNIGDENGAVDLSDEILEALDYSLISFHLPTFDNAGPEGNTNAMIRAMDHPKVRLLGHPDDSRFPLDYERLLSAAKEKNVFPELNNASLMPDAYRIGAYENYKQLLMLCERLSLPVVLSSDSHGRKHVGDFSFVLPLLEETGFPDPLVLNYDPNGIQRILPA
ncbi:MAG: phosphatase [Lachnospiraceae bacterium]|nr:phosphatase [Lachnospiraceae bacterium]